MQLTPTERGFRFFKQSFVENPWKELEKRAERQARSCKQDEDDMRGKDGDRGSEVDGDDGMKEEGGQMASLEAVVGKWGNDGSGDVTTKDA